MKLKFRAEKKDFIIFGIFCLVLLYLVAIALLNVVSFLSDYTFWGLNPLPAFGPDYIVATFVFFFFALAGIFLSVQSYFFERDKGFGITTQKKDKGGYSRWATEKEMKAVLTKIDPRQDHLEVGGIPLYNNGKQLWVDSGEYHNLIIGSTGSGKTQMMVQPMVSVLAKAGESMIITDPKGEIYETNGEMLRENGYKIVVLNFRNPLNGNSWNPFALPYQLYKSGNIDKSVELLEDLGLNIIRDPNNKSGDPFWENTSADYFTGLSVALFEDADESEINLNSINLMVTEGDDKCGMGSNYAKEYFNAKDKTGTAFIKASSAVNAPNETRGGILSVFKQKVNLFASRANLSEMLSHSDFNMEDIGKEKTAVFLIIQDEKTTYHPLVTIFLKQCYESLIDAAQGCPGGKLPYKTNFILDEFANMPPLKDVTTMVTAARSRNIRFTFIIQNFAQLNDVYGKEQAETIKGNCGNIIYLISSEMSALEEISKMCGEVKSKEKDKTASTPLATVSDLQRLPEWTVIILRIRMMPFKAKLTPYFKMEKNGLWGKKYEKATYPTRQKYEYKVFDIKSFVDKQRQDKMNEIFGKSSTPSSMDMPKPPFPMPGMGPGDSNVDDILKRIDEQIAKLEEEEKAEKEKLENKANDEIKEDSVTTIETDENSNDKKIDDILAEINLDNDDINDSIDNIVIDNDKSESNVDKPDLEMKKLVSEIDDSTKEELLKQIDKKIKEFEKDEETKNIVIDNEEDKPIIKDTKKQVENVVTLDNNDDFVTDDQFFDDFFNDDDEEL